MLEDMSRRQKRLANIKQIYAIAVESGKILQFCCDVNSESSQIFSTYKEYICLDFISVISPILKSYTSVHVSILMSRDVAYINKLSMDEGHGSCMISVESTQKLPDFSSFYKSSVFSLP